MHALAHFEDLSPPGCNPPPPNVSSQNLLWTPHPSRFLALGRNVLKKLPSILVVNLRTPHIELEELV